MTSESPEERGAERGEAPRLRERGGTTREQRHDEEVSEMRAGEPEVSPRDD